ncbi:MAG: hypothetical protein JNL58_18325 [Planctomyces sp.]|nr:hypothetical protein [Planctomyces sp.]
MATSLHQQLKLHYVADPERHEVDIAGYRIDAIDDQQQLIEIQCASLSSIRDKVRRLVTNYDVVVAKPLAARKLIIRKSSADGEQIGTRWSPSKQSLIHIFQDLVHFSRVFPHPRLRLDILLTSQEEIRIPPQRRRRRQRKNDFAVHDRRLVEVTQHYQFRTPAELWTELGLEVPMEFTTADMATQLGHPRWLCQKVAYCFREMGFLEVCSKQGNSIVYRQVPRKVPRRRPKSTHHAPS